MEIKIGLRKTIRNKSTQKFDLEYITCTGPWNTKHIHVCSEELQVDFKGRKIYNYNCSIKS